METSGMNEIKVMGIQEQCPVGQHNFTSSTISTSKLFHIFCTKCGACKVVAKSTFERYAQQLEEKA